MKILHTSDWHIGKKIMGRDRYDEYRAVLGEIYDVCDREGVDLCLVAGDVYDTYTPSAEAEEIFFDTILRLSSLCAVLIISGNHDDYVRLTASRALAETRNVYIVGNNLSAITCQKMGRCYPVSSGRGYAVFENTAGERVFVNMLPYPNEARFREEKTDESFADRMRRWIDVGGQANTQHLPEIFLSHIFVAGGKAGDTEREIDLGGARLVPAELLPKDAYCALGHLHRRQQIGDNIYYSGSVMRFSFDESNAVKSVNVFSLGKDGITDFKQVELKNIRNLIRLEAVTAEDGLQLVRKYPDDYCELTLNLSSPLTHAQTVELHKCENLISLRTSIEDENTDDFTETRKNKSASELFDGFCKLKLGKPADDDLKALFLELTEQA